MKGRRTPASIRLICLLAPVLLVSCVPEIQSVLFAPGDLTPASLQDWASSAPGTYRLEFDEAVRANLADFTLCTLDGVPLALTGVSPDEQGRLELVSSEVVDPGQTVLLSGIVEDQAGNATQFTVPLSGFNPRPAGMILNEVLCAGSSSRPDCLEFRVTRSGNLAGLTMHSGCRESSDFSYQFPDCEVSEGEYIVLHLSVGSEGKEQDEVLNTDSSGGKDALPEARDFWIWKGGALPNKNGVITLYDAPRGGLLDALVYSERARDSDQEYGGWGSVKLRERVGVLVAAKAWVFSSPVPGPDEAAWSGHTTSSRTICRGSDGEDTDSAADWHIVPTRGASIGSINNDAVHVP